MTKIIFSILFLGTAIVIFLGPVKNNWEEIGILTAEKGDFNTALTSSRELMNTRDDLIKKYNEIPEVDLARLDKLVPSGIEKMKLVVETENIMKKYGLAIKDIQVEAPDENNRNAKTSDIKDNIFDTVYLNVFFSGSYKSLISFIGDLENDLRIMEIENLSFSAEKDDWHEYSMKIKTYSKKIN